jgi:Tol biopolymer transport system component
MIVDKSLTSIAVLALVSGLAWRPYARAIEVISAPPAVSASASGSSFLPAFSQDGSHLAWVSHANNLVTNDDSGLTLDVFLTDFLSGTTQLISVNTGGVGGGNFDSTHVSVGRYGYGVAFAGRSSNLTTNDTNNAVDIFVSRKPCGICSPGPITLASLDHSGRGSPNEPTPFAARPLSCNPQMDALGLRVAFESFATNLTSVVDTNGVSDVFVMGAAGPAVSAVSVGWQGGVTGDAPSHSPQINDTGSYVSFVSSATNLVFGFTNSNRGGDIYVRNLSGGPTYWASVGTRNVLVISPVPPAPPSNYYCFNHALSGDGLSVVYQANAGPGTSNNLLYFRVGMTNAIRIATVSDTAGRPQISTQGDWVTFSSQGQVYLWNRSSGSNALISAGTNGGPANGPSHSPVMSREPNARLIAFVSKATDLVANSLPSTWQIYAYDRFAGVTRLVSANANGSPSKGDFELSNIAVAPEGQPLVAFDGTAADLVPGDLNGQSDVFVRDIAANTTRLISRAHTSRPPATGIPMSDGRPSVSADGGKVVFMSVDNPGVGDDTNGWRDVFLRDLASGDLRRIGGEPITPFIRWQSAIDPVISGAGNRIAYTVFQTGPNWNTFTPVLFAFDVTANANVEVHRYNGFGVTVPRISVSSNGNLIAFESTMNAQSIVTNAADGNSGEDIFFRDLASGQTKLVSLNYEGIASGNQPSRNATLSADGRWVAFETFSTNLLASNATFSVHSLFVRDLVSNITEVASVGETGNPRWGSRGAGAFSGNSRYVAFVGTDYPIVRRDLELKTSAFVASLGENPVMNWDGRFVAYQTLPFSGIPQIRVVDMQSGFAKLVSANLSGTNGNGRSTGPLLTPDGRFIIFTSLASDLVANDNNNAADIFIADRILGRVLLLTINSAGTGSANGESSKPTLSADGRTLVFQSLASDFVAGDYNDRRDIFVATLAMPDSDSDGMDDDFEVTYFGDLSRNGAGDFDGDGHSDHQEFLAGTDPTGNGSILRVISISTSGTNTRQLVWSAVAGRTYAVQYRDSLEGAWSTLAGTVRATSPTASRLDTTAASGRFYRVVLAE